MIKTALRGKINFGIVLGLLAIMLLSSVASADISLKTLSCDIYMTQIGNTVNSTTNYICGTSASLPTSIGLLGNINFPSEATRVRNGSVGTGPWDLAHFIDNSYPTGGIVTAYDANITMAVATNTRIDYAWYELGYYDPNDVPGNFVGLFNSSTNTSKITTVKSYSVTFSGQSGIVPYGHKLAIRVWANATNGTDRLGFYTYNGTGNSSILIDFIPNTMYNVSGYLNDSISGLPLNGAIVSTNTSQTTTTDAQGYYNLPGMANGSYNISATLYGYYSSYTIQTVGGADIINANISLVPKPTYVLSGYVTNQSGGAAFSGATVRTDSGQTTLTDPSGYYGFSLFDGTYTITASNSGYYENSITRTVTGGAIGNSNISLSTLPTAAKMLVATNRFVILDDWNNVGAIGTGFSLPGNPHIYNEWNGKNTRINATALFIDDKGTPQTGVNINFKLYMPNGTEYTAANIKAITDTNGLAGFSFDMDKMNYYGNWTVKASTGSFSTFSASSVFIYNWWGCGTSGGCSGTQNHASRSVGTNFWHASSPYLSGRENPSWNDHKNFGDYCTDCHQSFDSMQGGLIPSLPGGDSINNSNHLNHTADVHRNITCTNAGCHQNLTEHGNGSAVIGSCFNADCHTPANRSDISSKFTLNSSDKPNATSMYSVDSTAFNATFHTPNSTVPCIICHGPMHNISKPDVTQRFIRNNDTESSQCMTCHTTYTKHNGNVNCTVCHSDDVHAIKVFAQNATYVTLNKNNPNTYRGNCTNCHSNATFLNTLLSNPKAGSYTGSPITMGHISGATCGECHVNVSATDIHNVSLGDLPVTFNCKSCHTTYASKYGAANLIGTPMAGYSNCNGGTCHGNDITNSLDTKARHNVDRTFAGTGGSTDTVYLNNQSSLTVTKGVIVNVKSRVNDTLVYGGASRIGGAEYYIDVDPGQGKGIPMNATDGNYDALQNTWENVNSTIDTSSLDGTHTIFVRGRDIGKQWSAPKSATLVVESSGYINGTVTSGALAIQGVTVSIPGTNNITNQDGKYSLRVAVGTYTLNATKQPEYYDYTIPGIIVTLDNTTIVDIELQEKQKGNITGSVTTG